MNTIKTLVALVTITLSLTVSPIYAASLTYSYIGNESNVGFGDSGRLILSVTFDNVNLTKNYTGTLSGYSNVVSASVGFTDTPTYFPTISGPIASWDTESFTFSNGNIVSWYFSYPTGGNYGISSAFSTSDPTLNDGYYDLLHTGFFLYWAANTTSPGVWTLVNTSPAPIPSAIWLVGSALAGLVGFGRRKLLV